MREHDPLQDFFRAGDVPARDPGFRLAVMASVARRRFRRELAERLGQGLVVCLLVLIMAPIAGDVLETLFRGGEARFALVTLPLALGAALIGHFWLNGRLHVRLPNLL